MPAATPPVPPWLRRSCVVALALLAARETPEGPAAADRAFAARAAEAGVNAAFLEVLAPDGTLFRPGPVEGRAWMEEHADEGRLVWEPRVEVLSAAGDLGFTLGPYTYSLDGQELGRGHFLSVWTRVEQGWRLTADIGIAHATPGFELDYAGVGASAPGQPPALESLAAEAALRSAEAELARGEGEAGPLALLDLAEEGLVLLRNGSPPHLGLEACAGPLERAPPPARALVTRVLVSRSGDLAATWGALPAAVEGGAPGGWLRCWRRAADGAWRVLADVRLPAG